jgi:hypothetical protein
MYAPAWTENGAREFGQLRIFRDDIFYNSGRHLVYVGGGEVGSPKTEKAAEFGAFSALGDALETAAENLKKAASIGRESAKVAAQATRKAFTGVTYSTAYWHAAMAVSLLNPLPNSALSRRTRNSIFTI